MNHAAPFTDYRHVDVHRLFNVNENGEAETINCEIFFYGTEISLNSTIVLSFFLIYSLANSQKEKS
jgi:hypothetical protein